MARLSAPGAPVTPLRTSEEVDERSPNEEGASSDAMPPTAMRTTSRSNGQHTTTGADAMGQNESRETVRQRNVNFHAASKQATGKLSRPSGKALPAASRQRRMNSNVLSKPGVYDDLSDEDAPHARPRNANGQAFTPLRHQKRSQEEAARRREQQILLDQQFGQQDQDNEEEGIEEEALAALTTEVDEDEEVAGQDEGADRASNEDNNSTLEGPINDAQNALTENQPPQDTGGRKSRGRPRKVHAETAAGKRKRGRPTKEAARDAESAGSPQETAGSKRTRGQSSRDDVVQSGSAQPTNPRTERTSDRIRGRPSDGAAVQPPRKTRTSAAPAASSGARNPDPPAADQRDEQSEDTRTGGERRETVSPEDNHANDEEYNAPADAEEEPGNTSGDTEDEAAQVEGGSERDSEDEERPQATPARSHRLYNQWHVFRRIQNEANEHKGSKVRIKDDAFKKALQDCEEMRHTIRNAAAGSTLRQFKQLALRCRGVIDGARDVCGNGRTRVDFTKTKKRGFHIFKHLIPSLARLLKAVIEAYEQEDIARAGLKQISTPHLRVVLDLMHAIVESEKAAYDGYQNLSRPIKRSVHRGIAVNLRILCELLERTYRSHTVDQRAEEERRELAEYNAAMDEAREQQGARREMENVNRDKWKSLNSLRLMLSSSMHKPTMEHLRDCPSKLVETDDDGQPFLPDEVTKKVETFTMIELAALQEALQRSAAKVTTTSPIQSKMFEHVLQDQCRTGGALTKRNVLDIVVTANNLKAYYIKKATDSGDRALPWVYRVPQWLRPPAGDSVEDPLEID